MYLTQSLAFGLPFFTQALSLAISPRHVLYGRSNSGQATHYGGNLQGGACGFSQMTTLPANVFGTATANWDTATHCGQCVSVTGPQGKITAMIVDQCPGCETNQLDLFPDAFTALDSDPSAGVIQITWDYVDCPISSPLQLVNKEGVSAYWFSMQVVDATEQVTDFQVSTDGSTWTTVDRLNDNFFTLDSGTGSTSVTVKLTSASGSVVTVDNVGISPGTAVTASSNFGAGSSSSKAASSGASGSPNSQLAPSTSNNKPAASPGSDDESDDECIA